MLDRIRLNGLDLLVAGELSQRGVMVAFTGREGGSSSGPYSSLNLSYDVGDTRADVTANRLAVAGAIGVPLDRWVTGRQVHGACVSEVGPLEVGRGARDYASGIPRTDGLVSVVAGVALGVLTADCLPVVMVAGHGRAVAVAHAGWRGVLAGTAAVAMRALAKRSACPMEEILVFIGPHIGFCCMEAGGELADLFRRRFEEGVTRRGEGGGRFVDLERACELQLLGAGASPGNIFGSRTCTACSQSYFSFRGSGGECGRQGGFAALLREEGG